MDRASKRFPPCGREESVCIAASLRAVTHEWTQPAGEYARSLIESGIERRDLERASALVGTGAVAPGWLTSPGIAAAE